MKKIIFIPVASSRFWHLPSPAAFNVTGKLGKPNTKLYLAYQLGSNKVIDSAQVHQWQLRI